MWEYSDKVKEHFLNPRNVGEIEKPDAVGEVGSMSCGDALKLTFTVDENERILDARFKTFGCASAIASSSALTEMLKGKTIAEAEKITNDDIVAFLGGLPKEKMHCSVMGQDALKRAIACYRGEAVEEKPGNVVCECFGVTDLEIREALSSHDLPTVEEVTNFIKAGGGCGQCHERIEALIAESRGEGPAPAASAGASPPKMSNLQKIRRIEETLETEIAPAIQKDGGNIELVDVDGDTVRVRLAGACATCVAAHMTLKDFVERTLRERVAPELTVEEVRS
jgi:NifU-like protein